MKQHRHSLRWLSFTLGVPVARLKSLAGRAERCYHPFLQRRGGKEREIDNPNEELKAVQTLIRDRLLVPIQLPAIVHGCVKGRSAYTNAAEHVNQHSAASVDIRKCYPSITSRMVFQLFTVQFQFGPKVAGILTRLTTRRHHLPTGAPTSDALTNLILAPVDKDIVSIAERLNLNKTRFVDNIDFSGPRSAEAIEPTIRSLQRLGLAVSRKKVLNAGPGAAHTVTGYTVNGKRPSLSKQKRANVRAACREAILLSSSGDLSDAQQERLRGRLAYVARTNPQSAARMKKLLAAAGVKI